MKTLFIAEKPDIARAIAGHLFPDGYTKTKHYYEKGDTTVTWAFGHILRMAEPAEYDERYKAWSEYPIFPSDWKVLPMASSKEQLDAIGKLLKTHDTVVNAGDPDREGQLLVDEILHYFGYAGHIQRILINAKDDASLHRAFSDIRENKDFHNLYLAGLGRDRADWLIGMNLSRAYTVALRKHGYNQARFNIGRVKMPTLALVVRREREIQHFVSKPFYELIGTFTHQGTPFTAKFVPKDDEVALDEENRVIDKEALSAIAGKIASAQAVVTACTKKHSVQQPPLPHSLDTLQVLANKRFGYSPKTTLDTVQELYEAKYVSYPRSDCNYIPSSQLSDAPQILHMLASFGLPAATKCNTQLKSRAWNDQKITAHHALIPTLVQPKDLSETQSHIYQLIAMQYLIQFLPPAEYDNLSFTIDVSGETFKGSGRVCTEEGYRRVYQDDKSEAEGKDDVKSLPALAQGDIVVVSGYDVSEKQTKPPKRFTEGSLLSAMANIYRYMDKDNPMRDKLKEIKGIGTPATRDTIIAELEADSIKGKPVLPYLKKVKKDLVPTDWGNYVIDHITPELTTPDVTATMEYALAEVQAGTKDLDSYLSSIRDMVTHGITDAETKDYPTPPGMDELPACPICHTGHLVQRYSKKTKNKFWVCDNPDCKHPKTGKTVYYDDKAGKPAIILCPDCHLPLRHPKSKFGFFFACDNCGKTYADEKGKPVERKKKKGSGK